MVRSRDMVSWSQPPDGGTRRDRYESEAVRQRDRETARQEDSPRMKTMKSVMLLVAVIQLSSASGSVVSASQDLDRSLGRVRVRVTRAVPRHQCRRALRNLEVRDNGIS